MRNIDWQRAANTLTTSPYFSHGVGSIPDARNALRAKLNGRTSTVCFQFAIGDIGSTFFDVGPVEVLVTEITFKCC